MTCGDAHGTYAGYRRHLKHDEKPCDPCARARADYDRKRRYGLSSSDYEDMLKRQDERCIICGSTPSAGLYTDHSHATMEVRGLLCSYCNTMLGMALDSPEILRRASRYLTYGLVSPPAEFLGDLSRKEDTQRGV